MTDTTRRHSDRLQLIVERFDSDDSIGDDEIVLMVMNDNDRHQELLSTAIDAHSARALAAALLDLADLAERRPTTRH